MREMWDAFRDKVFWLLLAICMAGYFGLSPWLILPCALALTCCSVASNTRYLREFIAVGKLHTFVAIWVGVLVRDLFFAAGCFAMGIAVRWLWGPLA